MLRSQVVVINVVYEDLGLPIAEPAKWSWSDVVAAPGQKAVEVLAVGPLKAHRMKGEEE